MTTDPHPLGAAALSEDDLDALELVALGYSEADVPRFGAEISRFTPTTVLKLITQARRPTAPSQEGEATELDAYDAGLLSDHGGGDVDWWWDYIRAELERAHSHYAQQVLAPTQGTTPPPSADKSGDADELQGIFDLMWAADQRAIKRWQQATGKDMVWPDRAELTEWLLNKITALEKVVEGTRLTGEQLRALALDHDHLAVPIRPGVTLTWTDEESGEAVQRATLKGRNVVSLTDAALSASLAADDTTGPRDAIKPLPTNNTGGA